MVVVLWVRPCEGIVEGSSFGNVPLNEDLLPLSNGLGFLCRFAFLLCALGLLLWLGQRVIEVIIIAVQEVIVVFIEEVRVRQCRQLIVGLVLLRVRGNELAGLDSQFVLVEVETFLFSFLLLLFFFQLFLLLELQLLLCVSCVVVGRHLQPCMVEHCFGTRSFLWIPLKHGQEEVGEGSCFLGLELVLLLQDLVQGPIVETADSSQLSRSIEDLAALCASKSHASRHWTEQFHHLRQMVIILRVLLVAAVSWLEQEISGGHLKEHAGKRPIVRRGVVLGPNDDLR